MMKILFVEPAIFLSAFAMSLTIPLTTQYVYRRIWEETSNYSIVIDSNISKCEENKSSPIFILRERSPRKKIPFDFVFRWSSGHQHLALSAFLFCLTIPAFDCIYLPWCTLWQLYYIFGGCFAYIVDQCKEEKQKTIRIAVIDLILGLVTGLTGLSSGYFIRELGFVWSYLITALAIAVNLVYILFFLGNPKKESSSQNASVSYRESFKNLFYRTYMMFKNTSRGRRCLLCLLLFTMITYFFAVIGISPIFILYELDSPLCWNEVFIGYGSALGSVSFLSSFLGIWVFSYCLDDIHIAFVGILTTMTGMAATAFARTTVMMLLVRLPFLFTIVPLSVLRSMLSKVVRSTEQGTLFACIAFLETLGGVAAVSTFNGIYSATVAWYSGFTFLLCAGLLLIPAISLCVVKFTKWNEESYALLAREDSREDTADG